MSPISVELQLTIVKQRVGATNPLEIGRQYLDVLVLHYLTNSVDGNLYGLAVPRLDFGQGRRICGIVPPIPLDREPFFWQGTSDGGAPP